MGQLMMRRWPAVGITCKIMYQSIKEGWLLSMHFRFICGLVCTHMKIPWLVVRTGCSGQVVRYWLISTCDQARIMIWMVAYDLRLTPAARTHECTLSQVHVVVYRGLLPLWSSLATLLIDATLFVPDLRTMHNQCISFKGPCTDWSDVAGTGLRHMARGIAMQPNPINGFMGNAWCLSGDLMARTGSVYVTPSYTSSQSK